MILNGKEYKIPEIKKFSDYARYEEQGINLMGLTTMSFYNPNKLVTSIATGISYYTGLSYEETLKEIDEAIDNGEDFESIFESLQKDIEKMKEFGAVEGFSKGTKVPQDHKKTQKK